MDLVDYFENALREKTALDIFSFGVELLQEGSTHEGLSVLNDEKLVAQFVEHIEEMEKLHPLATLEGNFISASAIEGYSRALKHVRPDHKLIPLMDIYVSKYLDKFDY